jgi:DNA-binding NarL/FixJ family response regulator
MTRLVLIEDDPGVRAAVRELLSQASAAPYACVGEAGTLAEARALCARTRPDVLLLDLGLPDGNGTDLLREIRAQNLGSVALVLTVFGDDGHVFEALRAGAAGYLLKDDIPARLLSSLEELVAGGAPMSPSIARLVLRSFAAPEAAATILTPREHEVTELLAQGMTYTEVGTMLGVTTNTVRTFIRAIYEKLQVSSKTAAVREAMRLGIVEKP